MQQQIGRFLRQMADTFDQPALRRMRNASWDEALSLLDGYLQAAGQSKHVVVFDELQSTDTPFAPFWWPRPASPKPPATATSR